jgi:hypothetical protein
MPRCRGREGSQTKLTRSRVTVLERALTGWKAGDLLLVVTDHKHLALHALEFDKPPLMVPLPALAGTR